MSWVRFSSPYLDMRQMGCSNRGNETDTIIHKRNVFKQTVSRWQMRTALTSYLHSCLFAWQTPLAEVTSNPAVILKAYFEAYNQILPVNSGILQTQRTNEKSWNNDSLQNTSKEEQTNKDDDWIYSKAFKLATTHINSQWSYMEGCERYKWLKNKEKNLMKQCFSCTDTIQYPSVEASCEKNRNETDFCTKISYNILQIN